MCSEDLYQGNFQSRNFTVHEDTGKVKLNLEANIYISSIDGRRPPKSEPSVWDLVETGSLSVC
jgi:hypothetical protein